MARPTNTPRLHTVPPEDVTYAVRALTTAHITRLSDPKIMRDVEMLTLYAKGGAEPPVLDEARNVLVRVAGLLFAPAATPDAIDKSQLDTILAGIELDNVGLVLVGAWARFKLQTRKMGITARELGVLGGVATDHVRLLARKGEFTLEGTYAGLIGRAEARAWLKTRGVAGFE